MFFFNVELNPYNCSTLRQYWLWGDGPQRAGAAPKKVELGEDHYAEMISSTTQLNRIGADLANEAAVHAMTDVTGFGLLGHALEMARGSGLALVIRWPQVPLLSAAEVLTKRGVVTGASRRNWSSYSDAVALAPALADWQCQILTDPQTSGGLLLPRAPGGAGRASPPRASSAAPTPAPPACASRLDGCRLGGAAALGDGACSLAAGRLVLLVRFALLLGFQVLAGLLVDRLPRQPHLAAFVEAEELHLHLVAFLDDIGDLLHPPRSELAVVYKAVARPEEVDEGAEVHDLA